MKHIKFALYGAPGTGKSVFANGAPNRFFITTDGNYEFLEEFGAKDEDHIQVHSWSETKKVINDILDGKYDKYDTFVVDLLEDLFKWCEYEYCKKNGYEHVSDVGYAKGYDITRNEFFIEISRLLSLEKNVIFLMHGLTYTEKDRRGIEHTKHSPTNRLPDKVVNQIEGRLRMFLRCYTKGEEIDGKTIKKRYLSLIPKENEYGIIRGVNENNVPSDIPLDFKTFAEVIGLEMPHQSTSSVKHETATVSIKDINVESAEERKPRRRRNVEETSTETAVETPEPAEPVKTEEVKSEPVKTEEVKSEPVKTEEVKQEIVDEAPVPKARSNEEKLAAIMAKLGKK